MTQIRTYSLFLALLLVATYSPLSAYAQTKRDVDLEFEEVEGATQYEIELTSKRTEKVSNFKMKDPHWKANIRPGEYNLRMRSYDSRGVPGSWSDATPFTIQLPGPQLMSPIAGSEVKADHDKVFAVPFVWENIEGTKEYRVIVTPEVGEPVTKSFDEPHGEIELPVAAKYTWTVVPYMANGQTGDKQNPTSFTLIGKPLEKPAIEKPEDIYVQTLKWERPKYVKTFDYQVSKFKKDGTWEVLEKKKDFTGNQVEFPIEWKGGKYKISVKAYGDLRQTSKTANQEFEVYKGDRSPASVEEAKLRASLEKPTPWYFVASYMVTQVNYVGVYPESTTSTRTTSYPAVGGTGRLGVGYINPKSNGGYLGIVDLSGFTIADQTVNYAAAEIHKIWRYTWGRNMVRPSAGLFYKELVETTDSAADPGNYKNETISYIGPHAGFDFWRPFTSKLGMQINARLYYALTGSAPDGDLQPSMFYQFGAMGSYKMRQNVTGFLGYAYRFDRAEYTSKISNHVVEIDGSFLNLLLEWGF